MDSAQTQRRIPVPATLGNGKPASSRRRSGIVTQSLINQYGSFKAALDALNAGGVL